ncbi:MAG: hypothetical protein JWR72_880 [Flavisolibacter sp.]|nr:hypothetical protein [Flavisolibacter sp.]
MKKKIIMAGLAFVMAGAASAQKEAPPKPPTPPEPPVERLKEIPPPPPLAPLPPDAPPPPLPANALQGGNDYEAFLKKNPSVKSLRWTNNNEVIVRLKSGKEETYKLDDEKIIKEAEAKYGQLPDAPPPPPLPPPPPPPVEHSKSIRS